MNQNKFWTPLIRQKNTPSLKGEEVSDNKRKVMAGRPGFEPGLMESESIVLPLDDLPTLL
jgi:hypothetical protein